MKTEKDIVRHFRTNLNRLQARLIAGLPGGADLYRKEQRHHWWCRSLAIAWGIVAALALAAWLLFEESRLVLGSAAMTAGVAGLIAGCVAKTGFGTYKTVQKKVKDFETTLRKMRQLKVAASHESHWPKMPAVGLGDPIIAFGYFLQKVGTSASIEVSQIERSRPGELARRQDLKDLIARVLEIGKYVEEVLIGDLPPAYQNAQWTSPFQWPGKPRRVRSAGAIASMV